MLCVHVCLCVFVYERLLCGIVMQLLSLGVNPAALRSVADETSDSQGIQDSANNGSNAASARSAPSKVVTTALLAKRQLSRFLTITDINNFEPPTRPDACVFVVAQHDQYIPAQGAIADKWKTLQSRWPGAHVEWIRGGHVSAILFPRLSQSAVITDVVKKLLRRH